MRIGFGISRASESWLVISLSGPVLLALFAFFKASMNEILPTGVDGVICTFDNLQLIAQNTALGE
jgi:hypothetical protein